MRTDTTLNTRDMLQPSFFWRFAWWEKVLSFVQVASRCSKNLRKNSPFVNPKPKNPCFFWQRQFQIKLDPRIDFLFLLFWDGYLHGAFFDTWKTAGFKNAKSCRIFEKFWGIQTQGCRFVPYTFLETNKATDGTKKDLNIGVSPGALAAWFRAKSTPLKHHLLADVVPSPNIFKALLFFFGNVRATHGKSKRIQAFFCCKSKRDFLDHQ